MIFITQDDLTLDKTQAFYFYATWMPFHKKMMHMIEKMEEKREDISFFAIDVDHFKGLCRRFGIESIPSVVIFKDGKEIKRINGLVMTSAFKSAFADI